MRWPPNSPERKIEAFIGAWGEKTGSIVDTNHLLEVASRIFEVENTGSPEQMARAIEVLGKSGRKALAQKNLKSVMGGEGRFSAEWGKAAKEVGRPLYSQDALQRMVEESQPQLVDGAPFGVMGEIDIDPAKLLAKVVSAVISAGRADILWEFPDVLAFFGSRIPDPEEVDGHHAIDQRMFDAKAKWPHQVKG